MENSTEIKALLTEIRLKLAKLQTDQGEYQTFAVDSANQPFYIGQSPFLTAHISCLLSEINDKNNYSNLINQSIHFLDSFDSKNLRLFRFWYGQVNKTSFINLPYDLDDTAIVNQLFCLNQQQAISPAILQNNVNAKNQLETWWKPSFSYWLKNLKQTPAILNHFLGYPVFLKTKEGSVMADYKDSEICVRLNLYTYFELHQFTYTFEENTLPIQVVDVRNELAKSLHYENEAVYYYYLARFHAYSNQLNPKQQAQFNTAIQELIANWKDQANKSGDVFLLLLSLRYLRPFKELEISLSKTLLTESPWENHPILFCVGNKKFNNYHSYYSQALTYAVILRLFSQF